MNIELPNVLQVPGPREIATHDEVVADLVGVLLGLYGPKQRGRQATREDMSAIAFAVSNRLDLWRHELPSSCPNCDAPLIGRKAFLCEPCAQREVQTTVLDYSLPERI